MPPTRWMWNLRQTAIGALLWLVCVGGPVARARAAGPPITSATAREVSVLNDPKAFGAVVMVTGREVALLNDPKAFAAPAAAAGREVSLLNDPKAFASAFIAVARELTIQVGPVQQPGMAKTALTLAGGLATATASQKTDLNAVTTAPSANTIDVLDAVRLARKAAGLD